MPDAKVMNLPKRTYSCSFVTSSDAAVAHVSVIAAKFGVRLDVRAGDPTDIPDEPAVLQADSSGFLGPGVRLDERF